MADIREPRVVFAAGTFSGPKISYGQTAGRWDLL
jgi:hypothetical protein